MLLHKEQNMFEVRNLQVGKICGMNSICELWRYRIDDVWGAGNWVFEGYFTSRYKTVKNVLKDYLTNH